MILFVKIYLIGVLVAAIIFLYNIIAHDDEITVFDLFATLAFSLFSWISVLAFVLSYVDWSSIMEYPIWKRKKK